MDAYETALRQETGWSFFAGSALQCLMSYKTVLDRLIDQSHAHRAFAADLSGAIGGAYSKTRMFHPANVRRFIW